MYKFLALLFVSIPMLSSAQGPQSTTIKPVELPRSRDHFMIQVSSDRWLGAPDSINSRIKSTSRGLNVYVMLDKPFSGSPKWSVGFGLGVGTSHVFFSNLEADINGTNRTLVFRQMDTTNRFDKYKISTVHAEIPIELRFCSNPKLPSKSFKFAIGAKVGTLLSASSKGKTLENSAGQALQDYTQKIKSRNYFNTTRLAATARIGYGNFSVFGSYNITGVFKDNLAADMKLLQIGLTLSGL
jgi:hypothetical protein